MSWIALWPTGHFLGNISGHFQYLHTKWVLKMGNGIEHQGNELKNWKPDLYNEKRSFSISLKLHI